MNIQKYYYQFILVLFLVPIYCAPAAPSDAIKDAVNNTEKTLSFRYENEDLVNVINFLAAEKEVNVILPQGADAIKEKLTLKLDKRVTLDEAWNLLNTILDVAGYSLMPKPNVYIITKTTPQISREPMPIFIGTPSDELPNTDQRIRYVYYLENIKVPTPEEEANSELVKLFKGLMAPGYVFKVDTATNAIIVAGKSQDIKSAMQIVKELDKAGFQETLDILHLRHTQANIVANLFMQQILQPEGTNRYRLDARKQTETYFAKNTRIIPEPRTNSLILLGRSQAVERIRDFINEYIDVELDSGKSILHIIKLQYRDAQSMAEVLKKVLESGRNAIAEQARAEQSPTTGPERFFEEVKIFADTPPEQAPTTEGETQKYEYKGGNNLIVAARSDDWKRIKKLIEDLDDPQPQVLIEVLIADLTVGKDKQLGTQTRRPDKIPLPGEIEPQFANLQQSMGDETQDPKTIEADLLRYAYSDGSYVKEGSTDVPNQTIATLAPQGSTLISFNDNDGKTWSILQVLDSLNYSKILSHPHVISTNNQQASIKIGQTRLVEGGVNVSEATGTVKKENISANLELKITPRISEGEIVNLTVEISISEFTAPATSNDNTRATRIITTNANVKNGDILALGGLIRSSDQHSTTETPILSRVPILGWFFKKRNSTLSKTNLTVFISPMIIKPRLRGGISEFTQDYISVAQRYSQEGSLFTTLKEPITRWFFKTGVDVNHAIEDFITKDEFQSKEKGSHPEREYERRQNNFSENKQINNQEKLAHEKTVQLSNNQINLKATLENKNTPIPTANPVVADHDTQKNLINDTEKVIEQISEKTVEIRAQKTEEKSAQNETVRIVYDKQKRSQALQALINQEQEDENPLIKSGQTGPIRYLQS